jgi:two-component system sensor histidine kinase ResE
MHRMVLELLELARFDAGTLALEKISLDIGDLLQNLVKEISPQAQQAQVALRLEIDSQGGGLPALNADADRLAQVFSNLIDNALKYTPPGGLVTVSVRAVDGWLETQVADTGVGIPADELERIFERFYQTDKARSGGSSRGIGLGLAIAREIVLAHGGTIHAYNRTQISHSEWALDPALAAQKGSVFVVRLPSCRLDDETTVRKRKETPFRALRGS